MIRDRTGAPVFTYQHGPSTDRRGRKRVAKNASPEADLQKAVLTYLKYALPPGQFRVRAATEGARRSRYEGARAKSLGMDRGWPDLMLFSRRSRQCRWIELKSPTGTLTPEQKELQAELGDHMAVCRSVEEVAEALRSWGVTPRCEVAAANRYAAS